MKWQRKEGQGVVYFSLQMKNESRFVIILTIRPGFFKKHFFVCTNEERWNKIIKGTDYFLWCLFSWWVGFVWLHIETPNSR